MIFFSSTNLLNLAKGGTVLLLDGTFRSTPPLFHDGQLLNIGVYLPQGDDFIQIYHILMQNRKKESYSLIFKMISEQIEFSRYNQFIVDFEVSLIEGLKTVIDLEKISGCFFHYKQSLKRNFKKIYKNPTPL